MLEEMLQKAHTLAQALALEARPMALMALGHSRVSLKADKSVVTEADMAVQRLIEAGIRKTFPDHAVVGEEETGGGPEGPGLSRSAVCWVIDPIDGTRNFATGLPCFCTSIAVLVEGRPEIGVILEHGAGHLFTCRRGQGMALNGQRMRPPGPTPQPDRLIGVPSSREEMTVRVISKWVARRGLAIRNSGSTALHLAWLAAGYLQAVYCYRCKIWDFAAGALMVEEMGLKFTQLTGASYFPWDRANQDPGEIMPFLAGAADFHAELLKDVHA